MDEVSDVTSWALASASGAGRVPDAGVNSGAVAPFQMFAEEGGADRAAGASHTISDSLSHTWNEETSSMATRLFMSPLNVDVLQDAIRYRVYVESDREHVIGRQSDTELAIIMRSILLQHGRNDDGGNCTVARVRELNAEVLAFCVPRVLQEVRGYIRYRGDVSAMPMPMERGQTATSKGDRSLGHRDFM